MPFLLIIIGCGGSTAPVIQSEPIPKTIVVSPTEVPSIVKVVAPKPPSQIVIKSVEYDLKEMKIKIFLLEIFLTLIQFCKSTLHLKHRPDKMYYLFVYNSMIKNRSPAVIQRLDLLIEADEKMSSKFILKIPLWNLEEE